MITFDGTKAAYITIATGLFGLLINVNVAYAVRQCRMFGYAFGMLCLSQTISNIGNSLVFIFFTSGVTLINPDFHYMYLGRRMGQMLIFFWEVSIFSHLFISANRAVAVNFPTRYNSIFGDKKTTKILVAVIWIIAAVQAAPYSFPACSHQFDPVSFTLAYAEGPCGEYTEKLGDLTISLIIVTLIAVLDLSTFVTLYRMKRSHAAGGQKTVRSREIRLFLQACTQSLVLMFCECSFFFLSYMNEDPWFAFASTTFIWVFTHAVDGIVVIVFSAEIRNIILRRKGTIMVTSTMGQPSTTALTKRVVSTSQPSEKRCHTLDSDTDFNRKYDRITYMSFTNGTESRNECTAEFMIWMLPQLLSITADCCNLDVSCDSGSHYVKEEFYRIFKHCSSIKSIQISNQMKDCSESLEKQLEYGNLESLIFFNYCEEKPWPERLVPMLRRFMQSPNFRILHLEWNLTVDLELASRFMERWGSNTLRKGSELAGYMSFPEHDLRILCGIDSTVPTALGYRMNLGDGLITVNEDLVHMQYGVTVE